MRLLQNYFLEFLYIDESSDDFDFSRLTDIIEHVDLRVKY